jgi:hypothetical protein
MTPRPYIGVTGIVTVADLYTVRECCALMPWTHRFMAGVLVSAKTLRGEYTESRRYPAVDQVDAILSECARHGAWPVVHYNTRATGDVLTTELAALVRAFPSMRGLQLNVVRPSPSVVNAFAVDHPHVEVIAQMNRAAFGNPPVPADAILYARDYPNASHALLDLSGGRGEDIDTSFAARVARAWPHAGGLGVAGGLGPDAETALQALRDDLGADRFALLSFDAESRVRVPVEDPIAGGKHQDRLDRDRALAWVSLITKMVAR